MKQERSELNETTFVNEAWEKLNGQLEFYLQGGEALLNKNPDAETILKTYFSNRTVRHTLKQLNDEERREVSKWMAIKLLNTIGSRRLGSTFSRQVRDPDMQKDYNTESPAEALEARVKAEVQRLIEDGFLRPIEELLPRDLKENTAGASTKSANPKA